MGLCFYIKTAVTQLELAQTGLSLRKVFAVMVDNLPESNCVLQFLKFFFFSKKIIMYSGSELAAQS